MRPVKKTLSQASNPPKQPSLPGTSVTSSEDEKKLLRQNIEKGLLQQKIENSNLDLIQAMAERWKLEFPSGKIPDHLVTEAFSVTKSFWSELSKARKGTSS